MAPWEKTMNKPFESAKTFEAKIMLGLREGYLNRIHPVCEALGIIQEFCDVEGLCVTITETTFIYTRTPETPHGYDPGLIIGLIHYPRFPKEEWEIKATAMLLAKILKDHFRQIRVSVVCTDETVII
jgi:hypothetical protein